jgi:hypothetical protein
LAGDWESSSSEEELGTTIFGMDGDRNMSFAPFDLNLNLKNLMPPSRTQLGDLK